MSSFFYVLIDRMPVSQLFQRLILDKRIRFPVLLDFDDSLLDLVQHHQRFVFRSCGEIDDQMCQPFDQLIPTCLVDHINTILLLRD